MRNLVIICLLSLLPSCYWYLTPERRIDVMTQDYNNLKMELNKFSAWVDTIHDDKTTYRFFVIRAAHEQVDIYNTRGPAYPIKDPEIDKIAYKILRKEEDNSFGEVRVKDTYLYYGTKHPTMGFIYLREGIDIKIFLKKNMAFRRYKLYEKGVIPETRSNWLYTLEEDKWYIFSQ